MATRRVLVDGGRFQCLGVPLPPSDDDAEREIQSRLKDFVAKVIDETRPRKAQRKDQVAQSDGCALLVIGKRAV